MINTYNITKTQGLPFIAFLFHYMGPQNTPLNSTHLHKTTPVLYLAYTYIHICSGKKDEIHPVNSYLS